MDAAPPTTVDPRQEQAQWRVVRADVEARWMVGVLKRLEQGSALTCELGEAAGVKGWREFSRFKIMLERRPGLVCRLYEGGQLAKRPGPTGHANHVWMRVAK